MGILRKLFGPSSAEVWRGLSEEMRGTFIAGSGRHRDRVQVVHDGWTISLDNYFSAGNKHEYTRLRALYPNPEHFRFTIYRRGLFSDVAKWLGMQDVEIGHPDFDRDFIIKGTSERKLRLLFASPGLRQLIAAQPDIHFSLQAPDEPSGAEPPVGSDELCFTTVGVIQDEERLKQLFDLLSETLDQLVRLGPDGDHPSPPEPA